jgi:aspartate/methionine/tyrosine aminotransferase
MLPRDKLEAIAAVLRLPANRRVLVVADEIYERLEYDVPHVAFATLPGMRHRTVSQVTFENMRAPSMLMCTFKLRPDHDQRI